MSAKNIVKIHIGKDCVVKKDSDMPQMRIDISVPEQVIDGYRHKISERQYYMTPFRNYKFQVSGNEKGNGDYGSCQVVNLHHIIKVLSATSTPNYSNVSWGDKNEKGNIIHEVMKGLANNALMEFVTRHFSEYDGYKITIDNISSDDLKEMFGDGDDVPFMYLDALDLFVFASIIYLRKYYEYHNIPEYQTRWFDNIPKI